MDLGVFYEVIVPLMEVEGTATICISTPLDSFNFYSELTEIRDDKGKRIFNVRHIKGQKVPSWKSEDARSRIQAIYGDRKTLRDREIYGEITAEGENMAFPHKQLQQFFDKPPAIPPYLINDRLIYVAIDPNGGASASDGPGSDTAIVSFVVSSGRVIVSRIHSICSFCHSINGGRSHRCCCCWRRASRSIAWRRARRSAACRRDRVCYTHSRTLASRFDQQTAV